MFSKASRCTIACIGFCALVLLSIRAEAVNVTVSSAKKYQTIEGFGGGFAFRNYPFGRPFQDALHDSIFQKAGINVIRIHNYFDSTMENNNVKMEIDMVKGIQAKYPDVKVTMSSWSPPKYLKNRDTIYGMVKDTIYAPTTDNPDAFTLKDRKISLKIENGEFVYDKYADYWYNAVKEFDTNGVKIDWVSIQNEPDWPASWEGCFMLPEENKADTLAGYGKALDAVFKKFKERGMNVSLIGTDMTGSLGIRQEDGSYNTIFKYLDALDTSQLVAFSHHFYNGETVGMMDTIRMKYPDKPIFMTEWLTNDNKNRDGHDYTWTWYHQMQIIHKALTHENLSMYVLFALAFGVNSTHTFFSQDPANNTYLTRPIYYAFKHYSKSIKRGWKRIDATAGEGGDSLMVSAFSGNGDSSMTIVLINDNDSAASVTLDGIPDVIDSGVVHMTTRWGNLGTTYEQKRMYELTQIFAKPVPVINVDPYSIATIALFNTKYSLPEEEKVRKLGVNKRSLPELRSSLSVTVFRNRELSVSFGTAHNQMYTIGLYTIAGKQIVPLQVVNASHGKASLILKSPLAGGTYLIKVTSGQAAETRAVIIP
ncbi:MAG: hypothetical protein JW915_18295 [Chitinispirillaceae bacterium]|nr:hypothetical protein [Chitinispirillaceae bacterium]